MLAAEMFAFREAVSQSRAASSSRTLQMMEEEEEEEAAARERPSQAGLPGLANADDGRRRSSSP